MNEIDDLLAEEFDEEFDGLDPNDPMSEVQELVWALIDEQATDTQVARLEQLLLENDEARRTYVMCMQMHADLHFLLGGRQMELPLVIEQAKKAEAAKVEQPKKARTPLPALDLPSPAASPLAGEMA